MATIYDIGEDFIDLKSDKLVTLRAKLTDFDTPWNFWIAETYNDTEKEYQYIIVCEYELKEV